MQNIFDIFIKRALARERRRSSRKSVFRNVTSVGSPAMKAEPLSPSSSSSPPLSLPLSLSLHRQPVKRAQIAAPPGGCPAEEQTERLAGVDFNLISISSLLQCRGPCICRPQAAAQHSLAGTNGSRVPCPVFPLDGGDDGPNWAIYCPRHLGAADLKRAVMSSSFCSSAGAQQHLSMGQ